ncbi:MAG: hypothetical protein SFX18_17980 [Pirellulales bacterium]|nr:hypothetical protein [Pirellulales bacterium]
MVDITFSCLPLRTIGRLDIPLDASPKYQERCQRIKNALEKHGSFNSYYLYDAICAFQLTNHPGQGLLEFKFEGTVLTDQSDAQTIATDLRVELLRETCDWLRQPIVEWFHETVNHAVQAEFDLYIQSGDLNKAKQRAEQLQAKADESGGYMGMYL